jgi:ATP-dependent DNA helicase RecG
MELAGIKGLGPKTIKLLNNLDINNVDDLINYYPYRYNIIERTDITHLEDNQNIIIDGIVESMPNVFYFGHMNRMTFRLNSGTRIFNVTIFNRAFFKSKIRIGERISVFGKYALKNNAITASDMRFGMLKDTKEIEPVYHTTKGLSNKQMHQFINEALTIGYNYSDYVPDYLVSKYHFMNKQDSIQVVHNPLNMLFLDRALEHVKYEELFIFAARMNMLKLSRKKEIGLKRSVSYTKVLDFVNKLPFKLTHDQEGSMQDIYNDLIAPKRMNRLLQGDVGSGKTIVAFIALYINYLGGYMGALMAPTEILAEQHYAKFKELFKDYNINVALLTGKTGKKERTKILEDLKDGKIDVLIGTHALISDDVCYSNLGLVITDEQHRFGVNQRGSLMNKGTMPDVLYLSATPIPRTYALSIYGDMDVSSIHTMPVGRMPIQTYIVKKDSIKDVLTKMLQEIKAGHQIYAIAPMITSDDEDSRESVANLEKEMNRAFGKVCTIGVLHGKMKDEQKDSIMQSFKDNKIQILVATTVVEVGIDVPNATMMVIFDADSFGLSTLHQLRGRVGRSALASTCYLVNDNDTDRLNILKETTDGFRISEEDFKNRGSGDLFGLKQSGGMTFKTANLMQDFDLFLKAKDDSLEFITKYIDYVTYRDIKNKIIDANKAS